jgi:hypothetical protein
MDERLNFGFSIYYFLTLPQPFPQAGSFAKIAYQAIFLHSALLNNKGRV